MSPSQKLAQLLSLEQILACVGFSDRTFWCICKLWREAGDVIQHNYGISANSPNVHYLLQLVHHRPDWFLDELLDLLKNNQLVAVHLTTIYHKLS
ncbi:hypothetical protein BDR05DRAFT_889733 [Suillus weaverae]|nr:hypothetical protein BDR05DRAFT_889733 [Suillus weaverae]